MNKDYQEYLGYNLLKLYKAAKRLVNSIDDNRFEWDTYNTDCILHTLRHYSQKIDI